MSGSGTDAVDEAHRSQYDFVDGYPRHMRDALPHASFIRLHRHGQSRISRPARSSPSGAIAGAPMAP